MFPNRETGRRRPAAAAGFDIRHLFFAAAPAAFLVLLLAGTAAAVSISDSPMESAVKPAPPNIMFILDDSGSMDWEFLVEGSEDGLFQFSGLKHYLYGRYDGPFDADNEWLDHEHQPPLGLYLAGVNAILQDQGAVKGRQRWTSQWSGHNRLYYNPRTTYRPWPGKSDASTTAPLANPHTDARSDSLIPGGEGVTLNLSGEYSFWDASGAAAGAGGSAVLDAVPDDAYVVDDQDAGFSRTSGRLSFGPCATSTATDGWRTVVGLGQGFGDSFRHTECNVANLTATWALNPPAAGDYNVYVSYVHQPTRSVDVTYIVDHEGVSEAGVQVNQQSTEQQITHNGNVFWVAHIGQYHFNALGGEMVTMLAAISIPSPNSQLYSADAVILVPVAEEEDPDSPGEPVDVSIRNAHYYTWNDLDEDGALDAGERVYLVNFTASGGGGLDTRTYYRVDYDLDKDVTLLTPVTTPPNAVRSQYVDEDGLTQFRTTAEDLQNFANWFSYYRRRELAAKAAVANIIGGLKGVNVGLYSISDTIKQPVLPLKVESPDSHVLVVDDRDSTFAATGGWATTSDGTGYLRDYRHVFGNSVDPPVAQWNLSGLQEADSYEVFIWYTAVQSPNNSVPLTVHHDGTDYATTLDQTDNTAQWVSLGTFDFAADGSEYIRLQASGDGLKTSADAVMLIQQGADVGQVDQTDTLLEALYNWYSTLGGTPLGTAMNEVGKYFDQGQTSTSLGPSPYAGAADGGTCQQAFAIMITDGFWTEDADPSVGNQDGDQGAPYADNFSNTVADVSMKYFKNDLSGTLDNEVPTTTCDTATWQHMVTFTVSFGASGLIDRRDVDGDLVPDDPSVIDDPCFLQADTPRPAWPDPTNTNPMTATLADDLAKIDDLWHAAVNGRGEFFSAGNPEELIHSLEEVFENILARTASGASVSVNGDELGTDTRLFQAVYDASNWTGNVIAYPVDPVTGEILREADDIVWQASEVLQGIPAADRLIVTYNDVTDLGAAFVFDPATGLGLTASQKEALDPDWDDADSGVADAALENIANIVNYIRGSEIAGFRARSRKLGDIVHSAPLLVGNTIFAGGNDAMLHAFDAATGRERFAYIPTFAFEHMVELTGTNYSHRFFVDLTPTAQANVTIAGATGRTLLVGGLGKGGKGYYALDVTGADAVGSAATVSTVEDMVAWEYPLPGAVDDDLGFTFSRAAIVRSNDTDGSPSDTDWVVIFGNGYNSVNGDAYLYVVDTEGTVLRKILAGDGTDASNGLSSPVVIDVDGDRQADYAYAGDLYGNLWKFDLTDPDYNNWSVAYQDGIGTPKPLISVPGKPITAKPDVMFHCDEEGYIVLFGTGIYLDPSHVVPGDNTTQYLFGVWDYGDDGDNGEYLGVFDETASPQLSNQPAGVTLTEQTEIAWLGSGGMNLRFLSDNEPVWSTVEDASDPNANQTGNGSENPNPTASAGWFFRVPADISLLSGERFVKDMQIRDFKAVVISIVPDTSPCTGGAESIVHELDACTGARLSEAAFDITGDGIIDENDLVEITYTDEAGDTVTESVPPSGIGFSGGLHPPKFLIMPGGKIEKKIFSTSAGTTVTVDEKAERRGLFYWLEH